MYNVNNMYPRPSGGLAQKLTVDSTTGGVQIVAFTATKNDLVMFDVQGTDVFVTVDGTAPTVSNGHKLYATNMYQWSVGMMNAAKFISSTTSTSSIIYLSPLGV